MAKAITTPGDASKSGLLRTIEKMAAMVERLENADTNAPASPAKTNDLASERKVNRLYAQWLAIRACEELGNSIGSSTIEPGEIDEDETSDLDGDVGHELMATPSENDIDIFIKLEIFEYYITFGDGLAGWADHREVTMFTDLKLDLRRRLDPTSTTKWEARREASGGDCALPGPEGDAEGRASIHPRAMRGV